MATAAAIRTELEQVNANIEQETRTTTQLLQEVEEASERQRLRRQLDSARMRLMDQEGLNASVQRRRNNIDQDLAGSFAPNAPRPSNEPLALPTGSRRQVEMHCKQAVCTGTLEWKITGMSWLKETLDQADYGYAVTTPAVAVGNLLFTGLYCLGLDVDIASGDGEECHATLGARAVVSEGDGEDKTVLRYRFYIMRQDGQYVQWGQEGQVCKANDDIEDLVFGPDVTSTSQAASGIFGLHHSELLQSEWVSNDTLTLKVELEVRPFTGYSDSSSSSTLVLPKPKQSIEVPEATISSKFLSLLEGERCTDITFNVKGESIKAHSQVLAARSEVFERQFFGGLQESLSKEVVIDDMEPNIFKCFLKFLYTDCLEHIEAMIKECLDQNSTSSNSTGGTGSVPAITKASILQEILAVSHKYQELRLLAWCQQQLCTYITEREVCSVLCQAYLCEAQQLEAACLDYIKEHFSKIVPTKEFARLTTEWPELMLKISLHAQGVSAKETAAALSEQQEARKRKREAS